MIYTFDKNFDDAWEQLNNAYIINEMTLQKDLFNNICDSDKVPQGFKEYTFRYFKDFYDLAEWRKSHRKGLPEQLKNLQRSGIYIIYNIETKMFYVGQSTTSVFDRLKAHYRAAANDSPNFHSIIRQIRENNSEWYNQFIYTVKFSDYRNGTLNKEECETILSCKNSIISKDSTSNGVYNSTIGGKGEVSVKQLEQKAHLLIYLVSYVISHLECTYKDVFNYLKNNNLINNKKDEIAFINNLYSTFTNNDTPFKDLLINEIELAFSKNYISSEIKDKDSIINILKDAYNNKENIIRCISNKINSVNISKKYIFDFYDADKKFISTSLSGSIFFKSQEEFLKKWAIGIIDQSGDDQHIYFIDIRTFDEAKGGHFSEKPVNSNEFIPLKACRIFKLKNSLDISLDIKPSMSDKGKQYYIYQYKDIKQEFPKLAKELTEFKSYSYYCIKKSIENKPI